MSVVGVIFALGGCGAMPKDAVNDRNDATFNSMILAVFGIGLVIGCLCWRWDLHSATFSPDSLLTKHMAY